MTEFFSASYVLARQRFRDAAARLGWWQAAYPIGVSGPQSEALSIDVAMSSPDAGTHALVVSSGLHGVEGFFGSAVQLAALSTMAGTLDRHSMRVVFIHALNPYGFAWLRRVNEDNVDLNRNFLRTGEAYSGAPAQYAALDPLLNPRRPPRTVDRYPLTALAVLMRHGMPALRQSVAGGQYEFPQGLFFGGHGPSRTQGLLAEGLPRWLAGCRTALHLDLHTGLGRRAELTCYADGEVNPAWRSRLDGGALSTRLVIPGMDEVQYTARGSLPQWAGQQLPGIDYLGLTIDVGTCHPLRVLAGLRRENQAHHWGVSGAPVTLAAKAHLRRLFCPRATRWRKSTLDGGLTLVRAGMNALARE